MDYSQQNFSSWSAHLIGPTTQETNVPVGSKIVSIDFLQSGTASNTWVECGGMQIARNFARDAQADMAFVSTTTCQAVKTGNDESFVIVVYATNPSLPVTSLSTPDVLYLLVPAFFFFFFSVMKFWINYLKK